MLSRNRRRRRVFLALGLLVLVSPCAYFVWIEVGYNVLFRATLPVYPTAREVANAYSHEHAGTNPRRIYFLTQDSFERVRGYYENLASVTIAEHDGTALEKNDYYRTVFNPSGEPVPVVTNDWTGEQLNASQTLSCHYRLSYWCIEVEIIDFGESAPIELPHLFAAVSTPEPLGAFGGRLIVYTYYIQSG